MYKKSIAETIDAEIIRQIDKSNANHIGFFHQNIFRYMNHDWSVPDLGYDVVNTHLHYYVEMKNKHNTMNSSSAQKTYMRMQNTLLSDDQATCFLVEVIAKHSQNVKWAISLDGKNLAYAMGRRVIALLNSLEQNNIKQSVVANMQDFRTNHFQYKESVNYVR